MFDSLVPNLLTSAARALLASLATYLISVGVLPTNGENDFVAAGVSAALIAWSWWEKVGHTQMAAVMAKVPPAVKTQAAVSAGVPPAAVAIALFALALGFAPQAHAADMPLKAPAMASPFSGYPANSGFYFGINTALGTGQANGVASTTAAANAGSLTTQQGEVGLTVGYTWAMSGKPVWWAVEGTFDFSNINAQNAGILNGAPISLGGPADFTQVVLLGAPYSALASLLPNFNFNFPALTQALPAGVTASNGNGYLFIGTYEQDVSANFGQAQAKTWLVGLTTGIGTRWLLNNSTALDARFEYRTPSQSECVSSFQVVSGCAGMGSSYWARTAILF